MIHIQKDNEGFDVPTKDICSIDIKMNIHTNKIGTKKYINKVYLKIKPSSKIMCEDTVIMPDEFLYRFSEYNDIRSITIDNETYMVPWEDSKISYGINKYQSSKRIDNSVEIIIQKPYERKE